MNKITAIGTIKVEVKYLSNSNGFANRLVSAFKGEIIKHTFEMNQSELFALSMCSNLRLKDGSIVKVDLTKCELQVDEETNGLKLVIDTEKQRKQYEKGRG